MLEITLNQSEKNLKNQIILFLSLDKEVSL